MSRGIFLPLAAQDEIRPSQFNPPTVRDLGSVSAARLSLTPRVFPPRGRRPFPVRGQARLQAAQLPDGASHHGAQAEDPIRLLIADDVGVGKTIEALLIAKELLERREISRFAVLCPPHLCDQWQDELNDKFGSTR